MNTVTRLATATLCTLAPVVPASAAEVSPLTVDGAVTVDTAKARAQFEHEVAFVDIRRDSDFDAGRIPGAVLIELKKTFNQRRLAEQVGKDEAVVFYCNGESCLRSSQASKLAVGWGYSKIHDYRDGFPAWKATGNPVE